jgi:hypothetical protein
LIRQSSRLSSLSVHDLTSLKRRQFSQFHLRNRKEPLARVVVQHEIARCGWLWERRCQKKDVLFRFEGAGPKFIGIVQQDACYPDESEQNLESSLFVGNRLYCLKRNKLCPLMLDELDNRAFAYSVAGTSCQKGLDSWVTTRDSHQMGICTFLFIPAARLQATYRQLIRLRIEDK